MYWYPQKSSTPNETYCGSQFQKGCSYVVLNTRLPRRMFHDANIVNYNNIANKYDNITLSFCNYFLCRIADTRKLSHHLLQIRQGMNGFTPNVAESRATRIRLRG